MQSQTAAAAQGFQSQHRAKFMGVSVAFGQERTSKGTPHTVKGGVQHLSRHPSFKALLERIFDNLESFPKLPGFKSRSWKT
jgi:hypothetical protein